jgi:hypothetical protein
MTKALENSRIWGGEHAKPGCLPSAAGVGTAGNRQKGRERKGSLWQRMSSSQMGGFNPQMEWLRVSEIAVCGASGMGQGD